jgi:hypothetical protein
MNRIKIPNSGKANHKPNATKGPFISLCNPLLIHHVKPIAGLQNDVCHAEKACPEMSEFVV